MVCTYCDWLTEGDSLVMPRLMGVWPGFKVQSSHFPGRAFQAQSARGARKYRSPLWPYMLADCATAHLRNEIASEAHTRKRRSQKPRAAFGRDIPVAQEAPEARPGAPGLFQLCVLRLGLLEDGDVGVGVFPEREEILIGGPGFGERVGR